MVEKKPLHSLGDLSRRQKILSEYVDVNVTNQLLSVDLCPPDKPISIVVPAFNEAENLPQTIASLQRSSEFGGNLAEIIVVDNNSSDNTVGVVRDFGGSITPIRLLFNGQKGIAPTRKVGMDAVVFHHYQKKLRESERIIVMADADTIVPENWLSILFKQFKLDKPDMITGVYDYPEWVDREVYLQTGFECFFKRLSLLSLFLMQQGCSITPTIGANSAIEVGSYAFVGGINAGLKKASDHDLGNKVLSKNGVIDITPISVQTSPRRALEAMLRGVDFASLNTNWVDVRGSDHELLALVLKSHTADAWNDQRLLREGYIVYGRVVLPILRGILRPDKIIEVFGINNQFVKLLMQLIDDKSHDEQINGVWDNEKTESVAKNFSFEHGGLLISSCESIHSFKLLSSDGQLKVI